jgi:hypothetical protein
MRRATQAMCALPQDHPAGVLPSGFRRTLYLTLDGLKADLDVWLAHYNGEHTHQGKMCCGRTPLQTLIAGKGAWQEKDDNLN